MEAWNNLVGSFRIQLQTESSQGKNLRFFLGQRLGAEVFPENAPSWCDYSTHLLNYYMCSAMSDNRLNNLDALTFGSRFISTFG
jgi:hypothetical protein